MVTWCLTVGIKAVSKGLWKPVRTSRARWDNLVFQLMPVWQTEFKHIERNCTKFSERFLIATWSDLTKDFLKQCLQRRAAEEKWARIAHAKASLRWPILWINFCLSSFNLDPHRLYTIQDFSGPFSHATGQPDSLTRVVPNFSSSNRHRNMVRLSRTAEGWHKWSTWDVTRMSLVMSGNPNGGNQMDWIYWNGIQPYPAMVVHGCWPEGPPLKTMSAVAPQQYNCQLAQPGPLQRGTSTWSDPRMVHFYAREMSDLIKHVSSIKHEGS